MKARGSLICKLCVRISSKTTLSGNRPDFLIKGLSVNLATRNHIKKGIKYTNIIKTQTLPTAFSQ